MATDETRAEASNPGTSPARLQELTSDSELWPLIAANPNAYDALLSWLGENGGPDVQAALAARGGAAGPTSVLPSAPPAQAGPPLTPPPGGAAFPPPGGATPPPTGFPSPGAPHGASGGSKKGLWITLAVLVFLLVGSGIAVGVWALTKDDDSDKNDSSDTEPTDEPTDDSDSDSDSDSDRDNDDDSTGDVDCDALEDLEDAASDLTSYFPEIDEESVLDDAEATIQEFEDYDDADIAEYVDTLLSYADAVRADPDASFGDEWSDALDAEFGIGDYIFENC